MSTEEFIEYIAKQYNMSKAQAALLVESFTESLSQLIANGHDVELDGFGIFKTFKLFDTDFDPKNAKEQLQQSLNKKMVYFDQKNDFC